MDVVLSNNDPFPLEKMMPLYWANYDDKTNVWIAGFNVLGVEEAVFSNGPKIYNFNKDLRVVIMYGSFTYKTTELFIEGSDPYRIQPELYTVKAPISCYLLVLQPFNSDNNGNEQEIRENLNIIGGLIAIICGQNAILRRQFDLVIDYRENKWLAFTPRMKEPVSLPKARIEKSNIKLVQTTLSKIHSLQELEKNRVLLSLQWFFKSIHEVNDNVMAFLQMWFALESLGMREKDNLDPLNELLAKAYNLTSSKDANKRFQLGRIFGLRGKIVHQGQIFSVENLLLSYMEGLYTDILFCILNIPSQQRAEFVSQVDNFDIKRLTHGIKVA